MERFVRAVQSTIISPLTMLSMLWAQRRLIKQLVQREVSSRYKGTFLGLAWSFITPLFMLAVYTFFFSVILKGRWKGGSGPAGVGEFALALLSGTTAYNVFAEVVLRAPGLVVGVPNYVKKVVFPLEILPLVSIGSALVHMVIGVIILLVGQLVLNYGISPTLWQLPLVCIPLIALSLGFSWFLSSIGVFVRDIGQGIIIIVNGLMFLSPIFYPISSVPENIRKYIYLNPLAVIVENFRRTLFEGESIEWKSWGLCTLASLVLAWIGCGWFLATKRGFADVL